MSLGRLSTPDSRFGLNRSQLVAVIMAVLAISLVVDFSRKAVDSYRVKARAEEYGQMIEAAEAENQRLRDLKEFAKSNAFVEKEARRDFKAGRPEEVRVVIPAPVAPEGEGSGSVPGVSSSSALPETEEPYWQSWWQLFFDGDPPVDLIP